MNIKVTKNQVTVIKNQVTITKEKLIVFAILLVAFYLRWKDFMVFPSFRDCDLGEADFAWQITQGAKPWVGMNTYYGSWYSYLVAIAIKLLSLFDMGIFAPRTVSLIFGVATVWAVYLLTKKLIGKHGAYVSSALVAFQPFHIVINSRISWGNCVTPFFTTVAVYLSLVCWELPKSTKKTAYGGLAGLMIGFALNTHPSVLVFSIVLGLWFLIETLKNKKQMKTSFAAFALAFGALIAPLAVYNIKSGFGSVGGADLRGGSQALEEQISWEKYIQNIKLSNQQFEGLLKHNLVLDGEIIEKDNVAKWVKKVVGIIPALALVGLVLSLRSNLISASNSTSKTQY